MGLQEKRKIKELQDVTFPGRQKEMLEISGSPIAYDVDWESFADDMEALNFLDNISCHRVNMMLRTICMDQLGKDAIKDGLKTIKLKNVKEKKDMMIAFANGVLEMHVAYALKSDGMYGDVEIKDFLMKKL